MRCKTCGFENEGTPAVCSHCGADLPPAVICQSCGRQVRADAKYCVYCGERLCAPVPSAPPCEETIPSPAQELPVPAPLPLCDEQPPLHEAPPAPAPAAQIVYVPQTVCPAYRMPTRRGFWKMLLLGVLTGFLYPLAILSRISVEINMVASPHDGKRTVHFLFVPLLGCVTLGIYGFVWIHGLCERIGRELQRRGIAVSFGASTYWLWNFLYPLLGIAVTLAAAVLVPPLVGQNSAAAVAIVATVGIFACIGPCIFLHKLLRAMNLMNADYNEKG